MTERAVDSFGLSESSLSQYRSTLSRRKLRYRGKRVFTIVYQVTLSVTVLAVSANAIFCPEMYLGRLVSSDLITLLFKQRTICNVIHDAV